MSYRRIRGDLIEVFKFMNNMYKTKSPFELNKNGLRGHNFKLSKKSCNTKLRQDYFSNRVVDTWNMLDSKTVNAKTLNGFKNALDKELGQYMYMDTVSHPLRQTV